MAGPLPAVRYCTHPPSTVAVRTAIAALAPAVCCCARGATGCATSARTNPNTQSLCRFAMRCLLNVNVAIALDSIAVCSVAPGFLRRVRMRVNPRADVGHHRFLPEVVEEVMKMSLIQLQGLVR